MRHIVKNRNGLVFSIDVTRIKELSVENNVIAIGFYGEKYITTITVKSEEEAKLEYDRVFELLERFKI